MRKLFKIKENIKIFFFALLIIALFTNCATSYVTGERQFMLISEGEELKIGNNYAPQVTFEYGGAYNDREVNELDGTAHLISFGMNYTF